MFMAKLVLVAWPVQLGIASTALPIPMWPGLRVPPCMQARLRTQFHNQQNNDLSKFSTGDYIFPDTDFNSLIDFAKDVQSQTRKAAMYQRVDVWAAAAGGLTGSTNVTEDVDLDGEDEYLLYNDRLFAVFERIGGRMIAAWLRNVGDGTVYQVVGNQGELCRDQHRG